MKKIFSGAIIALAVLTLSARLSGNTKKRAAIMDFTANNTTQAYAKIVRNQMEVALYRTNHFEILERDKMELILKEQGFQVSGCTDTTCAVEIGKLLSVDYVVIGSIDRLGKFLISIKFIDIRQGIVAFADTEQAAMENDIPDAINTVAKRASDIVKGESKPEVARAEKKKPEKKIEEPAVYNPYGLPAFGLLGLTGLSLGGGFYFNTKIKTLTDDYNSLSAKYNAAATGAEADRLHKKMSDTKKESDKNLLYRNISYGAAAGFGLVTGYFFYKYFSYTPAPITGFMDDNKFNVMPLFMAGRGTMHKNGRSEGGYFMGGVAVRF